MIAVLAIVLALAVAAVWATVREAVLDRPRATPRSHRVDPDLLPPGGRLT